MRRLALSSTLLITAAICANAAFAHGAIVVPAPRIPAISPGLDSRCSERIRQSGATGAQAARVAHECRKPREAVQNPAPGAKSAKPAARG